MKKVLYLSCQLPPAMAYCLESHGYSVRNMRPSSRLSLPVSAHPDMLAVKLGNRLLVCGYYYNANLDLFKGVDVILTDEEHGEKYPYDVPLNVLFLNGCLYGNLRNVSSEISEYCLNNGIRTVNIRQGYAKCSCLCIGGGIVTADEGIAAAAVSHGADVLKIAPGHIALEGVSYGFIGGASFYDSGTAYFFGDLSKHPDGERIIEFCEIHNTAVISLSNTVLTDYGGGIVI